MSYQQPSTRKINIGLWIGGVILVLFALLALATILRLRQPTPAAPAPTAIAVAETAAVAPSDTPTPTHTLTPLPTDTPTPTPTHTPMPELGTSNIFIQYILDASGSMNELLRDGSPKIAMAQHVLTEHMRSFRPETNIGLRVYGHRLPFQQTAASCQDIELIAPVEKGQMEHIAAWLQDFTAQGMTPLAASLQLAREDFIYEEPRVNSVVMVSDGIETCGGDPCRLVEELRAAGINFTIHVIGLDVDEPTRQQLSCIARAGGGMYHDARSQQELGAALAAVKSDVTTGEVVSPPGVDTPTPAPPTPTPTQPAALAPGTFSLIGYYTSFQDEAWGSTAVCDRLVAVDGSQELIQEFLDLVDSGNTVNSKNSLNQPEINLDLSGLSAADVQAIKNSTIDQPVQLIVSRPPPFGGGAPVCFSMVRILDVIPIAAPEATPQPSADASARAVAPGQIIFFSNRAYDTIDHKPGMSLHLTRHQLYVMEADGSNQRPLSRDLLFTAPFNQALSPDRNTLLIAYQGQYNLSRLHMADPDTIVSGINGIIISVSWSPDNSQIAYTKSTGFGVGEQVWVMNADGTDSRGLTSDDKRTLFVDWSPDGNLLAASYDYHLIFAQIQGISIF